MTDVEESEGREAPTEWLGPGTWLKDRTWPSLHTIGVITDVREGETFRDARLCIRWRTNCYQNISVASALENFMRGRWRVDNGE